MPEFLFISSAFKIRKKGKFPSFFFQLRLHARQQNRVPRIPESYRGGISRAPDHQLGRDFMGEKAIGIVGRPGDPGNSITYGSIAARLSGLQGTHPFIPGKFDFTHNTRLWDMRPLVWNISFLHCRTETYEL